MWFLKTFQRATLTHHTQVNKSLPATIWFSRTQQQIVFNFCVGNTMVTSHGIWIHVKRNAEIYL